MPDPKGMTREALVPCVIEMQSKICDLESEILTLEQIVTERCAEVGEAKADAERKRLLMVRIFQKLCAVNREKKSLLATIRLLSAPEPEEPIDESEMKP